MKRLIVSLFFICSGAFAKETLGNCEKLGNKDGSHEILKKVDNNRFLAAVTICKTKNSCSYQDALVIETTTGEFKDVGFIGEDFWVESTGKKVNVKNDKGFDESYALLKESVSCTTKGMIKDYDKYAVAMAAKQGKLEVLKELVEKHNQDINVKDSNGVSVLDIARKEKQDKVVKYLESKGAKVGTANVAKEFVLTLVKKKDLPKAKEIMKTLDLNAKYDSAPMLYIAVRFGDLEMVKWMVDHGAKVDATDEDNITPLIVAAHNGNKEIVQYLISKKADVNHVGAGDRTPASAAQAEGHIEIVKLLKAAGAD